MPMQDSTLHYYERRKKPMVSTLFPQFPSSNTSPSNDQHGFNTNWWWTSDTNDLLLAAKMQECAGNGSLTELVELLQQKPLYFPYSTMHSSLLHCASYRDQLNIVNLLLSQKHDVNCGSQFECSPLHIALMRDHSEIAFELLVHGAICTEANITVACQWNSIRSLQVLFLTGHLRDFEHCTRVCHEAGHVDAVQMLQRMRDITPIEFATETLQVRALNKLLGERKLHALVEISRALHLLSRTKLKHTRPGREFKECKTLLFASRKRSQDMFVTLLKLHRGDNGVLLVLKVPSMVAKLSEMLGLKAAA